MRKAMYAIDTLDYSKRLQENGFSREQSEVLAITNCAMLAKLVQARTINKPQLDKVATDIKAETKKHIKKCIENSKIQ